MRYEALGVSTKFLPCHRCHGLMERSWVQDPESPTAWALAYICDSERCGNVEYVRETTRRELRCGTW